MTIVLRALRHDATDLRAARSVMEIAYGSAPREADSAAYLAAQPDGGFVIEADGEVVATAMAISYGSFCWLGSVATHPRWRRQGLAGRLSSHLVDWADARGCKTVALDASDAGRPVYERLGFRPIGATLELEPLRRPELQTEVGRLAVAGSDAEVGAALALDEAAFGADRSRFLGLLAAEPSTAVLTAFDSRPPCVRPKSPRSLTPP